MIELEKHYQPEAVEDRWNRFWLEKKIFRADEKRAGEAFSIVIPPPNVTGSLHIGHAFNNTLQDILARWRRMQGYTTLWQPGTDHAGIATQNVVERMLQAEGTDRRALGREAFVRRVWKWREESGGTIVNQLKKLGSSLDWDRDRFTMDEGLSRAVREVFVSLYEEGLVYKGDYIINWCPRCQTALSDLEVEFAEVDGNLYHIRYSLKNDGAALTVATTRPETLLGDTAVAVHPEDERYRSMIGRSVILPVLKREIPVIADAHVDREFGTGALKVTPAHDPNDFEIGLRHKLPLVNVLNPDATMNENAGPYRGLDRFACRKDLVRALEEAGQLARVEPIKHSVGSCYRCRTVVEPYVSKQWFVRAKPLAEPAIAAVKSGATQILPKFWENTYFEWMENIRDWCISRQIWWGHQIPAWTCGACSKLTVARETPKICAHCRSDDLTQESDVLDTWFSSALWPFSTLGWPDRTESLKKFYPTSVLCTGFDILFFWVARMMMMGLKFMKEVPFRHVYIHALVRDAEGQKMSKSKNNIIDPLVMMKAHGTDALRFTLAAFAAQGRDVRLAEDRIAGYRNFCNKLWNASRFAFMNLEGYDGGCALEECGERSPADLWILSRFNEATRNVSEALEGFRFNDAASAIYKFIWHEFCDWYIELSKSRLQTPGPGLRATQNVLIHVLEGCLKLLHPFMPFITEEIWQKLPRGSGAAAAESLALAEFPKYDPGRRNAEAEARMERVMDVVMAVRNIRGEMNLNPGLALNLLVKTDDKNCEAELLRHASYIKELARAAELAVGADVAKPQVSASSVLKGMEVIVPLAGLMNFGDERKRIEKELKKIEKDLIMIGNKLSNQEFVQKAPPEVIAKDRERQQALEEKQTKLLAHLKKIETF